MGFSPTIKQQAVIASARHYCVCYSYKGVKIEVRRIIQEADSGSNTFENAIPLSFDCHPYAGHFKDRHPKGRKISAKELLKPKIFMLCKPIQRLPFHSLWQLPQNTERLFLSILKITSN